MSAVSRTQSSLAAWLRRREQGARLVADGLKIQGAKSLDHCTRYALTARPLSLPKESDQVNDLNLRSSLRVFSFGPTRVGMNASYPPVFFYHFLLIRPDGLSDAVRTYQKQN